MLNLLFVTATAQESQFYEAPSPTALVSLTPEMSASAVSSFYSSLATSSPQQPGNGELIVLMEWDRRHTQRLTREIGPSAGDVGSTAGSGDSEEGASGHDSGSITLSQNGMIAIIVVIVLVCVFGSGFIQVQTPVLYTDTR